MEQRDLERSAADFWAGTGLIDTYPRPIEQAIALKLPVTVVKLPVVTVLAVGEWLRGHQRTPALPAYPRDLMGCLFAHGGHGFIFVCGADEADEQRFTLAHDTAHFLVDYWWPRRLVLRELGPSVIDVLDGKRIARPEEKAAAILGHVRLGAHWHLLPRPGYCPESDPRVAPAEERADDLGLELVAPRSHVLRLLRGLPMQTRGDEDAACAVLGTHFGLPGYIFRDIVARIRGPRTPSFLEDALRGIRG
jgi:hypothetical protein